MASPKYSGITIKIDDEEFIVPALSLGQLRNGALTALKEHDVMLAQGQSWEAIVLRGELILKALQRNYPDFDSDKLFSWLDVANCGPLWLAVLGISGFTPGEAVAAKTEESGTLKGSTEVLPQPTDGPIVK